MHSARGLGDIATLNHTFPAAPEPQQTVVQVYADVTPLGRVARVDYPVLANPTAVLMDLSQTAKVVNRARESWVSGVNGFVREMQQFMPRNPVDGVDFGEVVMALSKHAPSNCVLTTNSGNCTDMDAPPLDYDTGEYVDRGHSRGNGIRRSCCGGRFIGAA